MPPPAPNDVINLVVTCTNRKATPAHSSLQARSLKGTSVALRARTWSKRLAARTDGIPAANLYKGDHWSVIQSVPCSRGTLRVNVWIASAGYGLISPKSRVVSYAATLSGRHLDTVASSSDERRIWWASLTSAPPRVSPSEPRSIRQIASKYSSSPLIIAASAEYIDAMADDIVAASERLKTRELLSVLCRVGGLPTELEPFSVTLNASLASELGGALTSLNARVVRWLVSFGTAKLTRSTVRRYIRELSERCVARKIPKRIKMTDSEIRQHIQEEQKTSHRSRSSLLRVLREKGYAVEQARFDKIYKEIMEVGDAN